MNSKRLDIEEVRSNLKTSWVGRTIYFFQEVNSTNDVARHLALQDAEEGTVVIAEAQTCGRGRLGRKWVSPPGGVWLSIVLRPEFKPRDLVKINLLVAVAASKTLREEYGLKAEVKWPNDVLVDGKKICGVLTEAASEGDIAKYMVVGIGLNANNSLSAFPPDLRIKATTIKERLGKDVKREELVSSLLKSFEFCYEAFREGRFISVLEDWRRFSCTLGRMVEVSGFGERWEGFAVDVDDEGWLIIKVDDGSLRKIFSADVTLSRSKDA